MKISGKSFFSLIFGMCLLFLGLAAHADQKATISVVNNTSYTLIYDVADSQFVSATCQGTCSPTLNPAPNGGQQSVIIDYTQGGYVNLAYYLCTAVDYPNGPNGQAQCIGLPVGKVVVTLSHPGGLFQNGDNAKVSYFSPPQSKVSFTYVKGSGGVFSFEFTPYTPPPIQYPANISQYQGVVYRGINLSGGEFDYQFQLPNINDGAYFASKGANTVRLPFKWEYLLQSATNPYNPPNPTVFPDPSQHIDFTQGNALVYAQLVNQLTQNGMTVIIDMHNYMRYPEDANPNTGISSGPVIGDTTSSGSKATPADFAQSWADIATQFKNNPKVIFDLMNEPHDMNGDQGGGNANTQTVLNNYNLAIAAIRKAEASAPPHLILLEGNNYSGLHSWTQPNTPDPESNAQVFVPSAIQDSANDYAINVHQYLDPGFNGANDACVDPNSLLTSIKFSNFITSYMDANKLKVMVTETGGSQLQNCPQDINVFLSALETNGYPDQNGGGFIGWAGWAAGWALDQPGYSEYPLYLAPDNGVEKPQMIGGFDYGHLIPPASSVVTP